MTVGLGTAAGRAARMVVARPSLAIWALGGFLARGGLILGVALVPLPSLGDVERVVGPLVVTLALAGPGSDVVLAGLVLVAGGLGVGLAGLAVGGWADLLVAEPLGPSQEAGIDGVRGRLLVQLVLLRLASYLPLLLAAVVVAPTLAAATYSELVLPGDLLVPLPVRVVGDVPWAAGILLAAWVVSDVAAGAAGRARVLSGVSPTAALPAGMARTLRQPVLVTAAVVGFALLLAAGTLGGLLVGSAAATARLLVAGGGLGIPLGALLAATAWSVLLVVLGWVAAWRALWGHLLWREGR